MWMKGGGDAVKYVKQPKRHGCVEVVNELLIKIIDAPTKKNKVMEVSK